MSFPVYYVEEGDTLPHLFASYDGGTGASLTMTGLAVTDIEIYKDGSVTQRSSDAGYTLLDTDGIDFDGITGIHGFSIDLSNNTDTGFFAVGSWYHVIVSSVTVDAQTVNFIACAFRIVSATRGMAGTALPAFAAGGANGIPTDSTGKTAFNDLNAAGVRTAVGLASANLDTQLTAIDDYIDTEIAAIKAVTDNLPNGGTLSGIVTQLTTIDGIVDDILVDTGTTLPATLVTITGYLDTEIAAILADTNELQTDWANGGRLDLILDAIKVDTTEIGAAGAGLTGIPWNAAWDTEVQSEVNDGLVAFFTSAAALVDLVWDEATSGHTTAGTTGKALTDAGSAGDPWSTALPGAYSAGSAGYIIGNLSVPTVGAIADGVWDELIAGHAISGSTGEALSAAGGAGDPWITSLPGSYTGTQAGKILADILTDTGTTLDGKIDTIDGIVDSILADTGTDGVVVASGSKTGYSLTATTGLGNQTADITGSLSGSVGSVTGAVGSVTGNVSGNVTGSVGSVLGGINTTAGVITTLDALDTAQDVEHDATQATLAALNNLSAAQVNAEVVDALATDTYAEPGQGAPAATASLAAKINYLYKAWRNKKTQTATALNVFADDGTTVDQKSTVSDDGTTATVGEIASGP